MFGKRLTELAPIKEAVVTYMLRASEKLRAQKSLCKKIRVSIRTGMINPEEAKYANGILIDLPYPTDDVRLLTKAAVLLMNLCRPGEYTDDLFAIFQLIEAKNLMAVLYRINGRWGRGTLRSASAPKCPNWGAAGNDEPELYNEVRSVVEDSLPLTP